MGKYEGTSLVHLLYLLIVHVRVRLRVSQSNLIIEATQVMNEIKYSILQLRKYCTLGTLSHLHSGDKKL